MTDSYAYFRLPDSGTYTAVRSSSPCIEISDIRSIGHDEGFVMAPFTVSAESPAILIRADKIETYPVPMVSYSEIAGKRLPCGDDLRQYSHDFNIFHEAVSDGRFSKLVLARRKHIDFNDSIDIKTLFFRLCNSYPHLMVILFHSCKTGTWITATPEPIVRYNQGQFSTVAMAGTMSPDETEWSEKNRREQNIVERFIEEKASGWSDDVTTDGPYGFRAGNLLHLRTDISFHAEYRSLGTILSGLHPTPAVCGLPQADAISFIMQNETCKREYYSGFAGPVGICGHTELYVSLRCARIDDDRRGMTAFAGGGIMHESDCGSEFEETENKMQTILSCIATN